MYMATAAGPTSSTSPLPAGWSLSTGQGTGSETMHTGGAGAYPAGPTAATVILPPGYAAAYAAHRAAASSMANGMPMRGAAVATLPDSAAVLQAYPTAGPEGWGWTTMPAPPGASAAAGGGGGNAPANYITLPPPTQQHGQYDAARDGRPPQPIYMRPAAFARPAPPSYMPHAALAHGMMPADPTKAAPASAMPLLLDGPWVPTGLTGERDVEMPCSGCGLSFLFTANEQLFFIQRGYRVPQRCKTCRTASSQARAAARAAPLHLEEGDTIVGPCRSCHMQFVFSVREQEFFQERGFQEPVRCLNCRRARRLPPTQIEPLAAMMSNMALNPVPPTFMPPPMMALPPGMILPAPGGSPVMPMAVPNGAAALPANGSNRHRANTIGAASQASGGNSGNVAGVHQARSNASSRASSSGVNGTNGAAPSTSPGESTPNGRRGANGGGKGKSATAQPPPSVPEATAETLTSD